MVGGWLPAGEREVRAHEPVVSLRSTTGYRLVSLRDADGGLNQRANDLRMHPDSASGGGEIRLKPQTGR